MIGVDGLTLACMLVVVVVSDGLEDEDDEKEVVQLKLLNRSDDEQVGGKDAEWTSCVRPALS